MLPAEATESSEDRRGVRAGLSLDFFLQIFALLLSVVFLFPNYFTFFAFVVFFVFSLHFFCPRVLEGYKWEFGSY